MSRKTSARDWTYVKEIPAEITGQRRELMEMMLRATIRGEAQFAGSSPRTWKFFFFLGAEVGAQSTKSGKTTSIRQPWR